MELIPVKTLSYNAKVLQSPSLSCSIDGRFALFHDTGIYIMEMQCNPSTKDASSWHVCSIPPATETLEFDLGIDRLKLVEVLGQEDIHSLMLDRTLSPSIQSSASYLGYRAARWSSIGADQFNRSVLATLTMDHRLCIYEETAGKQQWEQVADLSVILYNAMKGEDYALVSNRISKEHKQNIRMQVLQQRSFALAALDMAWSPLYLSHYNTSDAKNFGLLVSIMKSGHLVLWKVQFPVTKVELDVVEVVDTGQDIPSAVSWCAINQRIGVASVGFRNGMLRSFAIQRTEEDDFEISEAAVLWPDADLMAITKLCWCPQQNVLLAAKGPYLLAFELKWLHNELIVTNKVAKLLSGKTPVCDLQDGPDAPYASISDNTLYKLSFSREQGLSIRTNEVLVQRDKAYSWGNHGIALSPNACYLTMVECPNTYYCHLTLKTPLKVHIVEMKTLDECVEAILEDDGGPLYELQDCLVRVHQYWTRHFAFPPRLEELLASTSWHGLSIKYLKLVRYLLQVKMQVPAKSQSEEQQMAYTAMVKNVERLTLTHHCKRHLQALVASGELLQGNIGPGTELTCIALMCQLLEGYDEESGRLISLIQQLHRTSLNELTETCKICQQAIPCNDLQKGGCLSGHVFSRCCQSLLLCQDLPYRVCSMCGALAVGTHLQGSSWFGILRKPQCTYCDFPLAW